MTNIKEIDMETPSFEYAKVVAKKFSDLLQSGSDVNMGTMSYWEFVKEWWERLKFAMGEPANE